jgi:hypothetical protein
VNPLIFRANRYVLWGEIKNLAFEDEKGKISRNDFSTAKSCKVNIDKAFAFVTLLSWFGHVINRNLDEAYLTKYGCHTVQPHVNNLGLNLTTIQLIIPNKQGLMWRCTLRLCFGTCQK